jgi:hypothetical protein
MTYHEIPYSDPKGTSVDFSAYHMTAARRSTAMAKASFALRDSVARNRSKNLGLALLPVLGVLEVS